MAGTLALVGAAVAWAFSARLLRDYRARRRAHALAWGASLLLYAMGMVALAAGLLIGWSATAYGIYWFTGALVNVPLLAVGELHLLVPARAQWWWAVESAGVTVALVAVLVSHFDPSALDAATADGGVPLGADVLGGQPAYAALTPLTLTGTLVVLVGTVAATVSGAISMIANVVQWGLIFGGGRSDEEGSNPLAMLAVAIVAPIAAMIIQFAISRQNEFQADATAAALTGRPRALGSALQRLDAYAHRIPMQVNPAGASLDGVPADGRVAAVPGWSEPAAGWVPCARVRAAGGR